MKRIILILALTLASVIGYSQTRPNYGGGKHTTSHGGTYQGGQGGSSHKGGTYSNPKTNNQYGTHKSSVPTYTPPPPTTPSYKPSRKYK